MRCHHYKQQINTSSWEQPRESTQHVAVELSMLIKHTNLTLHVLIITHQPKGLCIKMKVTLLGSPLNSTQMLFKTASFGEGTNKL